MLRPLLLAAAALFLTHSTSHADLVSIDYLFDDRTLEFNGASTATGGIAMSIVVDTSTPNLGSSFGDFDNFYDADVFFTSPGLGLNNEQVVSNSFLYFGSAVFGFTDTVEDFSVIFTAAGPSNLSFGSQFDLSTLVVPQGPVSGTANELRTARDIVFANGDRITGGDTVAVNSTTTVTAVPEPSSFLIFSIGIAKITLKRRRTRMDT